MGVIGLDYGVVLRMARMMRMDITPALLKKIMVIEDTALKSLRPDKGAA